MKLRGLREQIDQFPASEPSPLSNKLLFSRKMANFCTLLSLVSKELPVRRGSLYRRLVIPLSAFVLLASLALAIWISQLHRRESMRRFEQTAVSNAGFMGQVRFPPSPEMAQSLSAILEVEVAFLISDGTIERSLGDRWPNDLPGILESMTGPDATAQEVDDFDLAIAPLGTSKDYLVLVREKEGGLTGLGGWVLAPTLVLTAAFGCLVFIMAHRIVRPLTTLTRWLPNLKHAEEPAEPIPAALSERSDELGQLARSLQETHQSLLREQKLRHRSERLATLGRIATSLAHEIRNPAAAIRMHADLIAPSVEPESSESISLIREEVDRITDLVNQWLFVARAAPPERKPHDLTEMVEAVARRQKPALDHARSELIIESEGSSSVACDKLRMEQVVRNLVVNATQAMPEGGKIVARVQAFKDRVLLTISDAGKGFTEEALERFGEPFFSEREGGMGIGLTLAREVVQAHDGTIEASNSSAGGAVVQVSLPLYSSTETPS